MGSEGMDNEISSQLVHINTELQSIRKTLETLARVEERQFAQTKRMDRFEFRLDEYEREAEDARIAGVGHTHSIRMYERVMWALFAACLSVASVYLTR